MTNESFDLTKEAVLFKLEIGQAGITRRSRTLTREAAAAHEADIDSVKGVVQILDPQSRKEITRVINMARITFEAHTLPWDTKGYRLCPVTKLFDLQNELEKFQNEFRDAVDAMVANYPEHLKNYLKRVNDLAQEIPFPEADRLREGFRFDMYLQPLANPDDIRLRHVDPAMLETLRSRVAAQYGERLEEAQREIIERLIDLVAHLKEEVSKEDTRLFQSLVGNIEEVIPILNDLNFTNDPEIKRLIERVRSDITSIDVEPLRKDKKLRAETAKLAGNVLVDLKKFGL